MYKIEYSKDIEKDLSKLPKAEVSKVLARIERLAEDPLVIRSRTFAGKAKRTPSY